MLQLKECKSGMNCPFRRGEKKESRYGGSIYVERAAGLPPHPPDRYGQHARPKMPSSYRLASTDTHCDKRGNVEGIVVHTVREFDTINVRA